MKLLTKNIILIAIIICMLIAGYFTINQIENNNVCYGNIPNLTSRRTFNKDSSSRSKDSLKSSDETTDSNKDEVISENETKSDSTVENQASDNSNNSSKNSTSDSTRKRPGSKSGNNSNERRRPGSDSNIDLPSNHINNLSNSNNILYYILFGFESIIVGISGTLLAISNIKKLSKLFLN